MRLKKKDTWIMAKLAPNQYARVLRFYEENREDYGWRNIGECLAYLSLVGLSECGGGPPPPAEPLSD